MTPTPSTQPPFELARVLSDAFAVLRVGGRPLAPVFGGAALIEFALAFILPTGPIFGILQAVAVLAISTIAAGMATRLLYEAAYGRKATFSMALDEARRKILPLAVTGFGAGLGIAVGFFLLVAPGVWLIGVWSVIVPLIIIEHAEYDAFARSSRLTEDYRWQSAFALLLVIAPIMAFRYLAEPALVSFGYSYLVIEGVLGIIEGSLLGAVSLSIYKRLVEIKGDGPVDEISEVFR